MTMLSVNLNKVALVRNARNMGFPSVSRAAEVCLEAGAGGVTVHPRPDRRHTRPDDVYELAALLRAVPGAEFNVEGNPFPEFLELVHRTTPTQCTLVPDAPDALTSDRGWDLTADGKRLQPIIQDLQNRGIRVSLFMEPDLVQIVRAKEIGADRIELYTEPYARAYGTKNVAAILERYARAAEKAQEVGLGVNAGHDLNLKNLGLFCATVPGVMEVSIGHSLIAFALEVGLRQAVFEYLNVLQGGLHLVPHAEPLAAPAPASQFVSGTSSSPGVVGQVSSVVRRGEGKAHVEEVGLRPTTITDLDFVLAAEGEADTAPFILPWTREQHAAALADPDIDHRVVTDLADRAVGFVLLAGLASPHRSVEFRRLVVMEKGVGYGRAAVRAVVRLAFGGLGAHRLWLDVKTQNARARRLYESEGFVTEGVLRECMVRGDGGHDSLVIMSVLATEYART
jgi:pyridoxine 5-phosphate synthase